MLNKKLTGHRMLNVKLGRRRLVGRRGERGAESIEFAIGFLITFPALLWMFISGMNFIRHNKVNDMARGVGLMYLKTPSAVNPATTSNLGTMQVIERLGRGLDFVVLSGSTPVYNQGHGLVVLSRVMKVPPCSGCTNENMFVIEERFYIGNSTVMIEGSTATSFAGNPDPSLWNSATGEVANTFTHVGARTSSAFTTLWGADVAAGQKIYLIECFVAAPDFGQGDFGGRSVYTRVFM